MAHPPLTMTHSPQGDQAEIQTGRRRTTTASIHPLLHLSIQQIFMEQVSMPSPAKLQGLLQS